MTAADIARINLAVGAACTLTVLADVLLVPGKLGRSAVVEVAEGDLDSDLDVVASRFARGSSRVAVATEEAAEEVEGVVASTAAAALTVLLDTIVAPFVVYFACLFVA